MPHHTTVTTTKESPAQTCADCGMAIRRTMRHCASCGRPLARRISLLRSAWALITFWLSVLLTIYVLTAVLRFVAPVTLRVTCTAQVVPSRLLLVPTTTYTELLSAGDCAVPRGSVVVLTDVPSWLVAAAQRDDTVWSGWVYRRVEQFAAPVRSAIPTAEQAVQNALTHAWRSAVADLCTPTWIAQWCAAER